eukprot:349751-Chlamydomonas_euryale.AAC.5
MQASQEGSHAVFRLGGFATRPLKQRVWYHTMSAMCKKACINNSGAKKCNLLANILPVRVCTCMLTARRETPVAGTSVGLNCKGRKGRLGCHTVSSTCNQQITERALPASESGMASTRAVSKHRSNPNQAHPQPAKSTCNPPRAPTITLTACTRCYTSSSLMSNHATFDPT